MGCDVLSRSSYAILGLSNLIFLLSLNSSLHYISVTLANSREVKDKIWSNQIMIPGIVTICYKLGIIYLHLFYILSVVS